MDNIDESATMYKLEQSTLPRIRNYYRLGAFILLIILSINFYISNILITTEDHTVTLINISGRQQTLSQRIALLSNQVVTSINNNDGVSHTLFNPELGDLIIEMQTFHNDLFNGILFGEKIGISDKIYQMYTSKPVDVNRRLDLYLNTARSIQTATLKASDNEKDKLSVNLTYLINNSRTISGALNSIVTQYDSEYSQNLSLLRNTKLFLFIALIVIMILELWIIFVPLEHRISNREAYLVKQVNERRIAESNFRKIEYNYKLLAANLPNLSVMLFDKDMRYILADGPFLKRSGYNKKDIEGKTLKEIIPENRYDLLYGYYKEALSGNPTTFENISSNGSYYHTQIVPTLNSHDEITGGMIVTEDISDIRKLESELKELGIRFNQLSEHIKSGFWLTNADTNEVLYLSPTLAKIYRKSIEDLYRDLNSYTFTIHPDDVEVIQTNRLERIKNNNYNVEFRVLNEDGSITWLWSRAFPVKDKDGKMIRIAGIVEDITERKELENKAVQLEIEKQTIKLLSDFIRDTAHDLRTPLTIITTSSYLLGKMADTEEQVRHISTINKQVERLKILIEQLHSMSHIDTMNTLSKDVLDISEIVQAVHQRIYPKARDKKIQVDILSGEDSYKVVGDENYLFKAILSIYDNAILYTQNTGHISVTTYLKNDFVIVEIQDTGIGIAIEELSKIFQRFYKVNGARTSNSSGSGLGLTMAKLIIEKHGGRIIVESIFGHGSTFKIYLPSADKAKNLN